MRSFTKEALCLQNWRSDLRRVLDRCRVLISGGGDGVWKEKAIQQKWNLAADEPRARFFSDFPENLIDQDD